MARVPDTEENMNRCICDKCPVYLASECPAEKEEGFYCASGESVCNPEEIGCICGRCENFKLYELSFYYFCINGAAE